MDGSQPHTKATAEDWVNAALKVLIRDGVNQVKILKLADELEVSRSSFYWYFKDRSALLDALLAAWQTSNTGAIVAASEEPAETITAAVSNILAAMIDDRRFDNALDFAVRDWARRDADIKRVLDASDARRVGAITATFERFGYPEIEALTRARVLYYMQIGYTDADLREPMESRAALTEPYLISFTGQIPTPDEVAKFQTFANSLTIGDPP